MSHAPIVERIDSIARPIAANPAAVTRQSRRLPAIDAARGAAMVLVCLSHFAARYIAPAGGDTPGGWLRFIGHIASPMFFIISGAMVGYLFATRPEGFDRVRATLARRALFFLTIGHLLILGAHLQSFVHFADSARILFVTDTIAIALFVSPRLLRIPARIRLAGAAAAYVTSCALVYLWDPQGQAWRIIKETLVGSNGPTFWSYSVPLLPWLAVHAAGTVLGAMLTGCRSAAGRLRVEAQLMSAGGVLAAAAAAVRIGCWFLVAHVLTPGGRAAVVARQLATPWQRLPPSPAHILLFSGMALIGISAVFTIERLDIFTKLIAWLSILGKTSAFVFVLQFYVFYVVVPAWIPLHLALSPIVFLGAMLSIGAAARIWLSRGSMFRWHSWFGAIGAAMSVHKR